MCEPLCLETLQKLAETQQLEKALWWTDKPRETINAVLEAQGENAR